jgi:hypothetical protein
MHGPGPRQRTGTLIESGGGYLVPMNEQLPIPDYDHLPIGSLSHRIRALNAEGVAAILRYERAHADRVQLVEVLARRLDALRSGEAEPSTGDPAAAQPEHAPPARGASPVPTTSTTDNNQPLRHGVAGQTPTRDIRAR